MSTWFVDYEGGLDASDGLTFATRKKTLNAVTSALLTPGDEVRSMASGGRGNTNVTSTWTANSNTITTSTSLNTLLYDGEVAWTANVSGNVSCSTNLSMRRLQTSNAVVTNVHVDFVTGKASYFTLGGSTDCSGFTGLCFWYHATLLQNSSNLSIRLCSDTTGDVPVNTIPIPAINIAGFWVPIYVNTGSALSSGVQSIALYVDSNTAAINVMFQNINTVKSNTDANNLNLTAIINPGNVANNGWWGIRAINGTTIYLESGPRAPSTYPIEGYAGNTETVFLYKTDTTPTINNLNTTAQTLMDSGNVTHRITYSGGWNRTDMSTQTGETWFDGMLGGGSGVGLSMGSFLSYLSIDKINFARYTTGLSNAGGCSGLQVGSVFATGCLQSGVNLPLVESDVNYICVTGGGGDLSGSTLNAGQITLTGDSQSFLSPSRGYSIVNTAIALSAGRRVLNGQQYNAGIAMGPGSRRLVRTAIAKRCANAGILFLGNPIRFRCDSIYSAFNGGSGVRDNYGAGAVGVSTLIETGEYGSIICEGNRREGMFLTENGWKNILIRSLTSTNNLLEGLYLNTVVNSFVIGFLTTQGNGAAGVHCGPLSGGHIHILRSSIGEGTPLTFSSVTSGRFFPGQLTFRNMNGVAGDHRTTYHTNTAFVRASTEQRHTLSGISWQIGLRDADMMAFNVMFPFKKRIGVISVNAGSLVTIGLWCYRDNVGITGMLKVLAHQVPGLAADVSDTTTGSAGVWEQLTVSFTPTETATIEVEIRAWGGSTYNLWFDDISVFQS